MRKIWKPPRPWNCKYFSIEKSVFDGEVSFNLDDSSFRAFVVLEGGGQVSCGEESLAYRPADCFLFLQARKPLFFMVAERY